MLKEVSIATTSTYDIYYDFQSHSHPLLTTSIKEESEKVFRPPSDEEYKKIFTVQKN